MTSVPPRSPWNRTFPQQGKSPWPPCAISPPAWASSRGQHHERTASPRTTKGWYCKGLFVAPLWPFTRWFACSWSKDTEVLLGLKIQRNNPGWIIPLGDGEGWYIVDCDFQITPFPNLLRISDLVVLPRLWHSQNADLEIAVTHGGMVIEIRSSQPKNA